MRVRLVVPPLVLGITSVAWAQPALDVTVSSGVATDLQGTRSQALTVAPTVSFTDGRRWRASAFGAATQFATSVRSIGGGGAYVVYTPTAARLRLGLSTMGAFTATSTQAQFASASASPVVEYRIGGATLELGGAAARGVRSQLVSVAGSGSSGLLAPTGLTPAERQRRLRDSRTVYGPLGRLSWLIAGSSPDRAVQVAASAQQWRPIETAVAGPTFDADISVMLLTGPVALQGRVVHRQSASERGVFPGAAISYTVAKRWSISVGGGRYPTDVLTGSSAGRYLTASTSLRWGGRPTRPRTADVRGVPAPRVGLTRVVLRAPSATRVEVAGDWNDWRRISAQRAADGVWFADLALAPGEYRYAFVVDGRDWRVPDSVAASEDGFGGKVAWLTVRDRGQP